MAPKEHAEAVRSLARCDSTVGDHRGNYFSKVDQRVLPSLPAKGCWYLFMGSSELPGELKKLLKQPNGDPIGNVPPHSGRMLSYTDKSEYIVAVPWMDRNPHLIAPPLKASVPRSRVMHTRWEPESSTLEQIDAPAISRDRESTPEHAAQAAHRAPAPARDSTCAAGRYGYVRVQRVWLVTA